MQNNNNKITSEMLKYLYNFSLSLSVSFPFQIYKHSHRETEQQQKHRKIYAKQVMAQLSRGKNLGSGYWTGSPPIAPFFPKLQIKFHHQT